MDFEFGPFAIIKDLVEALDEDYQATIGDSLNLIPFPPGLQDPPDEETGDLLRYKEAVLLRRCREEFFSLCAEEGLNAHQALHSWLDVLTVEISNGMTLTSQKFCQTALAESLQSTVEELREVPNIVIAYAIQQKMPLAQAKAAYDEALRRQWSQKATGEGEAPA